jgi:iron complex outermembrane receptor protein
VIRALIILSILCIASRVVRSQPVDGGVRDPQTDPQPDAKIDAKIDAKPDAAPVAAPAPATPARITHQDPPIYPDVPLAQRKPVDVVVHVELDAAGIPTTGRVTSHANPAFDDLAVATALQWTFDPARRDGQPIASALDVTVHFDPSAPIAETITVTDELAPSVATKAPNVGASDYRIKIDKLGTSVPQQNATGLLQLAPGFLLTNEGGEGHAEQIFLRGFDAREGQDIEVRVNGDVINQAGNLHGNGYVDLHFIIPELVESLRVLEGPYDPRQGNFAVAGSAEYELGMPRRGLFASYELGSFGTKRALLLWGPPGDGSHTFGGVEIYQTGGFGQNRDARRATAMGQVEAKLGDHGTWRITSGVYITDYHSAGVIREDDYQAGHKGFYDTYDFGQGGAASRAFLLASLEHHHDDITYHHQLSLTGNTMRLREDFTGFLLDQQQPFQQPHGQRGDLIDLETDAFTAQAQGFLRQRHEWRTHPQEVELGYFARVDRTSSQEYRDEAANDHPYHKETDIDATLGDIGLYLAASLKLTDWLVLRGGGRTDLLTYNVIDNCAVHDIAHPSPSNPPGDASCLSAEGFGNYREPVQRATASGAVVLPRASLLVGPFEHVTTSVSYGEGVRSIDPTYIAQDTKTAFASIRSYEIGAAYEARPHDLETQIKLTAFRTHVDKDLIFSETVGRAVLAGGTTRTGASISGRVTGAWFDEAASATLVQSTFDDTKLLIPYVPDLVVRSDSAVFGDLPWSFGGHRLSGLAGLGVTYVGRRALPFGERSDRVFTIDGSASITLDRYTVGLKGSNLLDTRYRLGEYNFSSDFHSQAEPTLAIARHFTAGAPRTVLLHLEVKL